MTEEMLEANGIYDFQFAIKEKKDARLFRLSHGEEEKGNSRGFVVPWQTPIGSSMSEKRMHLNFYLNQVPQTCKHFF